MQVFWMFLGEKCEKHTNVCEFKILPTSTKKCSFAKSPLPDYKETEMNCKKSDLFFPFAAIMQAC